MPPDDIRTSSSALITSSSKGKVMISTLPLGRSPPGSSQLTTSSMSPVTPMQHPVGVLEAPGYSHSVLTKPVLYRSLPLQPSLNVASNVSEHGFASVQLNLRLGIWKVLEFYLFEETTLVLLWACLPPLFPSRNWTLIPHVSLWTTPIQWAPRFQWALAVS